MLKKKTNAGAKKSGGSGFTYHPRSSEAVQKRAEQQGGQFDSIFRDGVDKWRPADGENVIRILPPTWEDHDHYGYDIWIHGFVGPDKSTYLCPQKMKNEACPICRAARDAKAAGEEDEAKAFAARRQVAVWVINRDDEKSTPSLFTMSWSMDRDIASLCHNKRTGKVLLLDHPDEGYDIMFNRTGKGLNTRYIGMAVDREPSPIMADEGEQEKVLEYIQENPIPDLLNFYDADYLEKVIAGGSDERDTELDGESDDGEVEAPPPRRRPTTPAPARTAAASSKPAARAVSRRAPPAEEEAPDEEEEDNLPDDDEVEGVDEEEEVVEEDNPDLDDEEEVAEEDEPPPPRRPQAARAAPGRQPARPAASAAARPGSRPGFRSKR